MNYRMVFHTTGRVLTAEAALLLLPFAVALLYRESAAVWLFAAALCALAAGGALWLFCRPKSDKLSARDGFAIVSLSWVAVSLFGALPFFLSGEIPSFVDALFETVSGFTTTGASILTNVTAMSRGLLFWRSFTHWIGGMGVLVFIMAITAKSPDRSINILRAEMPGPSVDKIVPRAGQTAKILYYIYLALTVLEILLLLLGGMSPFESVVHAFGTAGTGGFGVRPDSIASYSPYLQWVITVFMLLFGVNFNLYFLMLMRRFRPVAHNTELWSYLGIFAGATLLVGIGIRGLYSSADSLRLAAFQVASLLSTTGYATADFVRWPGFAQGVLFVLMFCGGCAGSTGGGLKTVRLVVLFQTIRNEIRRTFRPRAVNTVRISGKSISGETERSMLTYFALYIAVMAAAFLLISFEPCGLETNLTAVVSCANNVGPGLGLVGPAASYAPYSAFSKIVLSLTMLLGRLEFYPLLLVMVPYTWTKK